MSIEQWTRGAQFKARHDIVQEKCFQVKLDVFFYIENNARMVMSSIRFLDETIVSIVVRVPYSYSILKKSRAHVFAWVIQVHAQFACHISDSYVKTVRSANASCKMRM